MQNRSKKILVVDDEEKIVEVLRAYLENGGYSVFEANNGIDALESFDKVAPSLVILDLMLPDISGEEVCKIIRRKSKTPIIMLTAKVEEDNLLNGLNIGADDYITKPFSPQEVLARTAAVLRRTETGRLVIEVAAFRDGYLTIDFESYVVKINGNQLDITPTEFKILSTLSKSPNKAFTREQLINVALEGDFLGYDRTIDTYIKNIRQKIEPNPRKPEFILTVHGVGYRFGGD